MNVITRALACAILIASAASARAGFFIPKDTTMVMGMHSPDGQTAEVAYGLSKDWSIAGGYHRYRSDDRSKDRRFTTFQTSYLVHRGYYTDGVSNVYVFGGPIAARSDEIDQNRLGLQLGSWVDYETRRIYLRGSVQAHDAGPLRQTIATAQALWAPYAADYEDVASWFGVQLQRRNTLSDATQVTPMLRFFQRAWWIDAGVSANDRHRGDFFLNVMILV